ncbi:Hypothetical predicted protein [Mytilus galloprovincialis]|uniref:Uncharacterized protein n=1 Tax=Mytilus galloprovincialis TaxID=29158 RepID=A0A8B6DNH8_MYTGA|nr:Hypothetical predicted protein [Mytilus galloprovincialis]
MPESYIDSLTLTSDAVLKDLDLRGSGIDAALGLRENQQEITTKYIKDLKDRITQAHELATTSANKARDQQKSHYDNKVRGGTVKVGDRVLVKIVSFEGKHKLADRWEQDPYTVLSQQNEDILFSLVKEGKWRGTYKDAPP